MTEWKVCTLAKTVLTHNILIPHTPSIVSRRQRYAEAAQVAGHRVIQQAEDMRQKHQPHTCVAEGNDLGIVIEECEQRMPEMQDERHRDTEHDIPLQQGQQQRLFAAFKLACAIVLANEGRAGLTEGVENVEGDDLHVPCRARRRSPSA